MKIKDRVADYVLTYGNPEKWIKLYFPLWSAGENVICPFHDDKNASLSVSSSGAAMCHGCEFKATNIIDLHAKMSGLPYLQAADELYKDSVDAIPMNLVHKMHSSLTANQTARAYLYRRGICTSTIQAYQLGYDHRTKRIAIPIIDEFSVCVNIRYYSWAKDTKYKMINHKGHGEARIFPAAVLANNDNVLLVEGEWDALTGNQIGIPTITTTGGAGCWDPRFNRLFVGKHVTILYDADEAGKNGAYKVLQQLGTVCDAAIYRTAFPTGKDLNDWFLSRYNLEPIKRRVMKMKNVAQVRVCPTCGRKL